MTKNKIASIDFSTPEEEALRQFWDDLNTQNESSYKIQLLRQHPAMYKGMKVAGYLKTYYLPITIPDIMEQAAIEFGGGKYQVRIVDEAGKYIKSKIFEVVGSPRISPDAVITDEVPNNLPEDVDVGASELESIPIPTNDEMHRFLIRRSLLLLKNPRTNHLETLKFLKELYRT